MNPKCEQEIIKAANRALTRSELKGIDDSIKQAGRNLAIKDPAGWRSKSVDQRTVEAASAAMQALQAAAALKVRRVELQIIKTMATADRIGDMQRIFGVNRTNALVRDLERVDADVQGLKQQYFGSMLDTVKAASDRVGTGMGRRALMSLFDVENPRMTADMASEIHRNADGSTGNQLAQRGVRAYLDVSEAMRQRFNNAGGDVGKLDYGYIPLPDNPRLIRKETADEYARKNLARVNRDYYLRPDGARMDDVEVSNVLRAIHETKSNEGRNKTEPGQRQGAGMRANHGSKHRQLHLKDGPEYLEYLADYGSGTMFEAMVGHIDRMARDIVLVEAYGPNPDGQMRLQIDLAERADGPRRVAFVKPESYYNVVSGKSSTPDSEALAKAGIATRAVQVGAKLGGAVITAMTDINTMIISTGYNKLPYFDVIKNVFSANTADARDFLNAHGLMAESLSGSLRRWHGDYLSTGFATRVAGSVLKVSLLNAWTDGLRAAFNMTLMAGTTRMAKKGWAELDGFDRYRLESHGITDADWGIISKAIPDDYKGTPMLTPDSIMGVDAPVAAKERASMKYVSWLQDEAEYAVTNPDLLARTMTGGWSQSGTVHGEFFRMVGQFKSFPISMITRHWRRMLDTPNNLDGTPVMANKAAMTAMLTVTGTVFGAIVLQSKALKDGKDPYDMTNPKFWGKAFIQGGGAGFLGDVLFRDSSHDRSPQQGLFELLGPTFGSVAQLYELAKGNADELAAGKDTHAGAEALQFGMGHLPYGNLWYSRGVMDHLFLHALQEGASPGYLDRIERRSQNQWGQKHYWKPGTGLPDRAPDLTAVAGGSR